MKNKNLSKQIVPEKSGQEGLTNTSRSLDRLKNLDLNSLDILSGGNYIDWETRTVILT